MKRILVLLACAGLVFADNGCVTDNTKFPTPTASFSPKLTYAVGHDKLWQAALNALENNHIAVLSADKADGIIRTDYISGPSEVMIPLGISQITRYKYNIIVRDEGEGTVKLNVICTVEDSMSSGHDTSQWHDVTSQNAALATKLETWLYEKIEGELKSS